jgi:predicted regulator of Ras-like GTPase activity (Roadblock/LC7/MglB family)
VAEAGDVDGIDTTSLASLVAGNVAASGGLAKVLGEEEFPVHFHQGKRDSVHITVVAQRMILVVIFDDRSSLGLVRLRVKKASQQMGQIFEEVFKKAELEDEGPESPFSEITDDDIDNLFSD